MQLNITIKSNIVLSQNYKSIFLYIKQFIIVFYIIPSPACLRTARAVQVDVLSIGSSYNTLDIITVVLLYPI